MRGGRGSGEQVAAGRRAGHPQADGRGRAGGQLGGLQRGRPHQVQEQFWPCFRSVIFTLKIGLKCDKESYTNLIKEDAMHLQFTPPPIGTLGESLKTFQHTFLFNLVRKCICRHVSSLRDNSLLVLHGLQDTRVNVSNTWALARSLVSQVKWGHGSRSVD